MLLPDARQAITVTVSLLMKERALFKSMYLGIDKSLERALANRFLLLA